MKAARYGCAWALAVVALGCRDDIVLRLPLDPVPEQTVEKSFVGRTGADYVLWSDYNLDTPASKAGARFCYEIVVDVVQEGAVVATTSCGPFPHSGTLLEEDD